MSKFTSYFPFGQIGDEETYLGLSPDSEDGIVINTLDQNMILRIEVMYEHNLVVSLSTFCLHCS